jgi:predicted transcriptional regulator
MLMPCEAVIKEFLPAMRANITKILDKKYDFTQEEIADRLGLTQAAVSKYLSGDYSKEVKVVENISEIKKMAEMVAGQIAVGNATRMHVIKSVCKSCQNFFGDKWNCEISNLTGELLKARGELTGNH